MQEQNEKHDPIRVVIADDHPVIRQGLRMMLEMAEGFELVGEAADGATAVQLAGEYLPSVILMDLRMPGMDGLEAIQHIHQQWPQIAVLILTTYNEDDLMIRSLQSGACGYLLKDTDLSIVLHAITTAARGEMHIQTEIMQRILLHASRAITSPGPTATASNSSNSPGLTERERTVLEGVARGERSKEIAARLLISERTVEAYLSTIYTKLGVDSRASAVAVAMKHGILPLQN